MAHFGYSGVGTIISGLVTYYLPIESDMLKLQIGMVSNEIIQKLLSSNNTQYLSKIFKKIFGETKHVIIKEKIDGLPNPIYTKIENYIIDKFKDQISSYELIPKKGDIIFMINNNLGNKIKDIYKEHIIEYDFDKPKNTENSQNQADNTTDKGNVLTIKSKTANANTIKDYVKQICKINKVENKILKIYRPIITNYGGRNRDQESSVNWDLIESKTNKNFDNTIVAENIQEELYQDIEWFMANEDWYTQKGIPYKRGYILYGPPGTGKTSLIKAIANTHNLPIFNLDMESISNNNEMTKLVSNISYQVQNNRYIMTCEDIDRFLNLKFNDCYYSRGSSSKVTIDCILNVLDGILETYGRITFFTCNDIKPLSQISAMMRPGRIDKTLLINYCDTYQIKRIFQNFYSDFDEELIDDETVFKSEITPAQLIKMMQKYHNDYQKVLDLIVISNSSPSYSDDSGIQVSFQDQDMIEIQGKNNKRKKGSNLTVYGTGFKGPFNNNYSSAVNRVARNKRVLDIAKKKLIREEKYLVKLKEEIPVLEKRLKKSEEIKEKKHKKDLELKNKSKFKCGFVKKNGEKCTIGVKAKGLLCGHHRPRDKKDNNKDNNKKKDSDNISNSNIGSDSDSISDANIDIDSDTDNINIEDEENGEEEIDEEKIDKED